MNSKTANGICQNNFDIQIFDSLFIPNCHKNFTKIIHRNIYHRHFPKSKSLQATIFKTYHQISFEQFSLSYFILQQLFLNIIGNLFCLLIILLVLKLDPNDFIVGILIYLNTADTLRLCLLLSNFRYVDLEFLWQYFFCFTIISQILLYLFHTTFQPFNMGYIISVIYLQKSAKYCSNNLYKIATALCQITTSQGRLAH